MLLFGALLAAIFMKSKNAALAKELEMTRLQSEKELDKQNEQFEFN